MTTPEEFDFEWEERKDDVPFRVHMLAGSLAGLSEHVLLLPIDNLKTHIQTKSPNISTAFSEIRKTGPANFFRGSAIIAAGCIPSHAFFFLNYEIFKRYMGEQSDINILGNAALGAVSNLFHDIVMTPCELIKQRAQITGISSSTYIIKKTIAEEGVLAFWRSFPVNFVSNLPNAMITVSANENLKKVYSRMFGEHTLASYFACAGTAGVLCSLITTPLDNIKTRLNVQQFYKQINEGLNKSKVGKNGTGLNKDTSASITPKVMALKREYTHAKTVHNCGRCANPNAGNLLVKYPNAMCAMKIIKTEEGMRGFYKGLTLRLTTQSLSTAIAWTTYEYFKSFLIKSKF